MDADTLNLNNEWKNTYEVLKQFGEDLINRYKEGLAIHNANASNGLKDSLKWIIEQDGGSIELDLSLAYYAKFLDIGTKGTESSPEGAVCRAHFPPVSAIREWIRVKPIIPQPDKDGRLPTENQLAYLIGRKIHDHGIEPRGIYEDSVEETFKELEDRLTEAITKDVQEAFSRIFMNFTKNPVIL